MVPAPGPKTLDSGPCYFLCSQTILAGSSNWPKIKSSKQVSLYSLVWWVEMGLGRLDRQIRYEIDKVCVPYYEQEKCYKLLMQLNNYMDHIIYIYFVYMIFYNICLRSNIYHTVCFCIARMSACKML